MLATQVWPHRLRSGFPDEVRTAGKTGSWSATAPAPYSSLNTNEWRKVLLETVITVDAAIRKAVTNKVLAEFKKQLARDRVKTMAGGFSSLGLLEMTRKRTRESLAHMLCEPCPSCQGKGIVKTPRTVAYDILREILREARQFNPREFRVVAAPAVIDLLLDEESTHLAGLSDFIAKPISLQAEGGIGPEQYDIILL